MNDNDGGLAAMSRYMGAWLQRTNLWRERTSPRTWAERLRIVRLYPSRRAERAEYRVRPALPTCPGPSTAGALFRRLPAASPSTKEPAIGASRVGASLLLQKSEAFHPRAQRSQLMVLMTRMVGPLLRRNGELVRVRSHQRDHSRLKSQ